MTTPWFRLALTTLRSSLTTDAPLNVLSYGENHYKCDDEYRSVHAEAHAIRKLAPLPRHKRPKKVDLLVVRINQGGSMGSSKPCIHCCLQMACQLPSKGYQIGRIYYSTQGSGLASAKLSDLLGDSNPHVSRYFKERNLQLKPIRG
jgi:hypothetical protein